MALGDFYEVTLFQSYRNQVMINRWHYRNSVGAGNAVGLLASFQTTVLPKVADIQADDVTYTRLLVQNLITPADNQEDTTPTPAGGTQINTAVPLRLAWAFRSQRPDLSKRYSWKRFGGIASNFLVGDEFDITASQPVALAAAMFATLPAGITSFVPVQLHFEYPGNGAPPVITENYQISNWSVLAEPSTQNTRFLGRGI